jgi:hypothetical protein
MSFVVDDGFSLMRLNVIILSIAKGIGDRDDEEASSSSSYACRFNNKYW